MQHELLSFAFGSTVTIGLLGIGHWFPWLNGLGRLQAYIYGTASIWIGFSIWRFLLGDWLTPLGFAIIAILGGAVVLFGYGWDAIRHRAQIGDAWLNEKKVNDGRDQ